LKSTLNSASFDTHKPHSMKKIFGPLYCIVLDPAKNDLSSGGHFIKMNIFRGYFHSKSNFRQKLTHPNKYLHYGQSSPLIN
jgi:hypothetical protein